MSSYSEIHRRTTDTYEAHAEAWDQQRPKVLFEKEWLDRFIAYLPDGGAILDVGCGAGEPMARYLLTHNVHLTGMDASRAMIAISRSRFPQGTWIVGDMREIALPQNFDGIIGWDSFFHLNPDEQRETLKIFCRHLNSGGTLLLTIGDEVGEVLGVVNGEPVYHASLAPEEYRAIFKAAGFTTVTIVLCDETCGEHSVLLASGFEPRTIRA